MSLTEAKSLVRLYQTHKTYLQICVQRRFSNLYSIARELVSSIGHVYSLYAEYTLALKSMDESVIGWRANRDLAGGGASQYPMNSRMLMLTSLPGAREAASSNKSA